MLNLWKRISRSHLEKNFFDLDLNTFQQVFNLNFLGTLLPTVVFSKDMIEKGKGVILNISSITATRPLTRIPAFSASQFFNK